MIINQFLNRCDIFLTEFTPYFKGSIIIMGIVEMNAKRIYVEEFF